MVRPLLGGDEDGLLTSMALELGRQDPHGLCQLHLRDLETVTQPICAPSSRSVKREKQHAILGLWLR